MCGRCCRCVSDFSGNEDDAFLTVNLFPGNQAVMKIFNERLEPNQRRTLSELLTELQCRNFVSKHRPSIQIGAKSAKTCIQCACVPTEPPFCIPPLLVGSVHNHSPLYVVGYTLFIVVKKSKKP